VSITRHLPLDARRAADPAARSADGDFAGLQPRHELHGHSPAVFLK
jgi:hypothetical protein